MTTETRSLSTSTCYVLDWEPLWTSNYNFFIIFFSRIHEAELLWEHLSIGSCDFGGGLSALRIWCFRQWVA